VKRGKRGRGAEFTARYILFEAATVAVEESIRQVAEEDFDGGSNGVAPSESRTSDIGKPAPEKL
jgi:hypothetical protein